jgi:hypothetical protein
MVYLELQRYAVGKDVRRRPRSVVHLSHAKLAWLARVEDVPHGGAEIAHRQGSAHRGVRRIGDHLIVLRNQLVIFLLVEIAEPRRDDIRSRHASRPGGVDIAAGLLQADEIGQPCV